MIYLLIGIGGTLGAICRYNMGIVVKKIYQGEFPLGTFIINSLGSFFLGVLYSLFSQEKIADWIFFFLGIGFCGAFTTFSTFSYEAVQLLILNKFQKAFFYVSLSTFVAITFAWLGFIFF